MRNKILAFLLIATSFIGIVILFWQQELQYQLPTPIPQGYKGVNTGTLIQLPDQIQNTKPVLIHFFNPECPCSRFNIQHFLTLARRYQKEISFYAIVTQEEDVEAAQKLMESEPIPVLTDTGRQLAKACGVYSTPQAVLLDRANTLYYRGNYNRARYCTEKKTSYAEIAIESLIANHATPVFDTLATRAYGCQLPQKN